MFFEELVPYAFVAIFIFVGATLAILTVVSYNYESQPFDVKLMKKRLRSDSIFHSWRKFPSRLWRFFIPSFLIPKYRDGESWDRYKNWNCRSKLRHTKKRRKYRKVGKVSSYRRVLNDRKKTDLEKRLELEEEHDHKLCERIKINVNGQIFETQLRTLYRFPDTLLGNPNKRIKFYDPVKNEYFFDRNRNCFEWILYYYQSGGRLCRPENIQNDVFYQEIYFFKLERGSIERYEKDEGWTKNKVLMDLPKNLYLRKIWLLFDVPESSMQATCVALLSVFVVLISIATFCMETLESFKITKTTNVCLDMKDPFFFLETICSLWFCIELIFRFASCPGTLKFIKSFVNIVDIVAVLPYVLTVSAYTVDPYGCRKISNSNSATSSLAIIRVVRLVRVFRVLKLSRHNKGLKILGLTLASSLSELLLLIFFVGIGTILFSSIMYFTEKIALGGSKNPGQYESIPYGFWWALQTLTTVGYGDIIPRSFAGKMVGTVCAIAGVLTLSLPVPVIVSNFNSYYRQEIDEMEQRPIPYKHSEECPYLPGGYSRAIEHIHLRERVLGPDHNKLHIEQYIEPESDSDFESLKFENKR